MTYYRVAAYMVTAYRVPDLCDLRQPGNLEDDFCSPEDPIRASLATSRPKSTFREARIRVNSLLRVIMPGDDDYNPAQNNAVALQLPTFWSHQPRVWFAQAEAHSVTRSWEI